ncbi:MAG: hypothetical protein HXS48_13290 [Theionarchaea archaeon]|nr:hypothetical protein [Theionarchaea archaeon]
MAEDSPQKENLTLLFVKDLLKMLKHLSISLAWHILPFSTHSMELKLVTP